MKGILVWITGLAGSGKTTIGKAVCEEWKIKQTNTVFLDGDHFREITGQTAMHSKEARLQVAYQLSRMCKFLTDQNINVICSTISLFKEIHELNRNNFDRYCEIYIHCDMEELINRDQKNLYTKALKKEIKNVVGIDITFDRPENCDLEINNSTANELENKVNKIINLINTK